MHATRRGFTLLELLVVLAIMAISVAAVSLSLRDSRDSALEHEALRLNTLLEVARAHSRASGIPITWHSTAQGYTFTGVATTPNDSDTSLLRPSYAWLNEDTGAYIETPASAQQLQLGPEPVIPAQTVILRLDTFAVRLSTDGLRPFAPVPEPATEAAP